MLQTAAAAFVMEHCTQRYAAAAAFVALTMGGSDAHERSTLNYVSKNDWFVSGPKTTQQQIRHVRAVAKLIGNCEWLPLCKTGVSRLRNTKAQAGLGPVNQKVSPG